jgi:hypothetical protein
MVSCGEALTWTLRCTIAIVDLPALLPHAVPPRSEVYVPAASLLCATALTRAAGFAAVGN